MLNSAAESTVREPRSLYLKQARSTRKKVIGRIDGKNSCVSVRPYKFATLVFGYLLPARSTGAPHSIGDFKGFQGQNPGQVRNVRYMS